MDPDSKKHFKVMGLLALSFTTVLVANSIYKRITTNNRAATTQARIQALEAEAVDYIKKTEKPIEVPSFVGETTSFASEATESAVLQTDGESSPTEQQKSYGRDVVPTVLGTISAYTGSASFDYPISAPAGPAGFGPSLSISYSSTSVDDARAGNGGWDNKKNYKIKPSLVGHGFSLGGIAAVVRDTRGRLDLPVLVDQKGEYNHRFIVTLPGSGSFEVKYNGGQNVWTSVPSGILNIQHVPPKQERDVVGGKRAKWYESDRWVITTKDGTRYFFGEEEDDLDQKVDGGGKVKDGQSVALEYTPEGICRKGTPLGYCERRSNDEDPKRNGERGDTYLIPTKWYIKKIQTADNKVINFTYKSESRFEGPSIGSTLSYSNEAVYPTEISWNEAKHHVVFDYEPRPGFKGPDDEIKERLASVRIETKLPSDNIFHLVRRYKLNYYDINGLETLASGASLENNFNLDFLKSLEEFGTDDKTTLPPTTFRYTQVRLGPLDERQSRRDDISFGKSGDATYLSEITNGYGGKTSFTYEPFIVGYKSTGGHFDKTVDGRWGSGRARVIEKTVSDAVENRSFKEVYKYGQGLGFAETSGIREYDDTRGKLSYERPPTGMQFLGHDWVDVQTFDFDGAKVLSHSKTIFNQANDGVNCFEPHPAKGQPKEQITYNGSLEAKKTLTSYRYRLDDRFDLDPNTCDKTRVNQPLFPYAKKTDSIVNEPAQDNFIPGVTDKSITDTLKTSLRTASENLEFDRFGNLLKTVTYGEVDPQTGADLNPSDNRYSYSLFTKNFEGWYFGLPAISYTSEGSIANGSNCANDNMACQRGRSESLYDNNTDALNQTPTKGYVTEQRNYLSTDTVAISKNEYDNWGNVVKTFSPKPNDKTTGDLITNAETEFDSFYHTFPTQTKNNKGHKSLLENYDFLLGVPRRVKTQINATPERFSVTEMTFDSLGRAVKTFAADPQNPGSVLSQPASIKHYFEQGDKGLVVRASALTSKTMIGVSPFQIYEYSTTDSFYNGLGAVRQTQVLNTLIEGKEQRVVSTAKTNAAGAVLETYDTQLAPAVNVNPDTIQSPAPELQTVNTSRVTGKTTYDALNRPVEAVQIDPDSGQQFKTTSRYLVNATKATETKGVEKVTIADSWGRTVMGITSNKDGKQILVTSNTYGKPLIDSPTKTDIYSLTDLKDQKITSTFVYDDAGRLVSSSDPSLGSYTFEYDILGNKKWEKSPTGEVSFSYDTLGRLFQRNYSSKLYNRTNRDYVEYTYDNESNALGKVTKIQYPVGETHFEYDQGARLVKTQVKTFDKQKEFTSQFNELSQLTNSTYPGNTTLRYEYDKTNSLQKVFLNDKELLTGVEKDKFGKQKKASVVLGADTYVNETRFDALGRIRNLSVKKGAENIFGQTLSYNQYAEISSLAESLGSVNRALTFGYDGFSQLKNVTGAFRASYDYDIFGRMTRKVEGTLADGSTTVAMTYSPSSPFFAAKTATITNPLSFKLPPPGLPTGLPVNPLTGVPQGLEKLKVLKDRVSTQQSVTSVPRPTLVSTTLAPVKPITANTQNVTFSHTPEGAMKEDQESCYEYNQEGQLVAIKVKQNKTKTCAQNPGVSKFFRMYYDHEGNLVLNEEYNNKNELMKQTYIWGTYEETYDLKKK